MRLEKTSLMKKNSAPKMSSAASELRMSEVRTATRPASSFSSDSSSRQRVSSNSDRIRSRMTPVSQGVEGKGGAADHGVDALRLTGKAELGDEPFVIGNVEHDGDDRQGHSEAERI